MNFYLKECMDWNS